MTTSYTTLDLKTATTRSRIAAFFAGQAAAMQCEPLLFDAARWGQCDQAILAERNKEIIGIVTIAFKGLNDAGTPTIDTLYVTRQHRHLGIGLALFRLAVERLIDVAANGRIFCDSQSSYVSAIVNKLPSHLRERIDVNPSFEDGDLAEEFELMEEGIPDDSPIGSDSHNQRMQSRRLRPAVWADVLSPPIDPERSLAENQRPVMPWRHLHDPDNPENGNAGNGGDLVKHTVYLTVLDYLLARSPWSTELRVRECHAGRGMYRIPSGDIRRPLLECLYTPLGAEVGVLLHDVQRASQTALGVWPAAQANVEWYSGSAVLNARQLASAPGGRQRLELYELAADTRAVLRAVFTAPGLQLPQVDVQILPHAEDGSAFDGELHIENSIAAWKVQDIVLLDPFAMWRQPQDQLRRDRYRQIIERLIERGDESPSLLLFWTWGRAFPVADGDLDGTNTPVPNGYQELRGVLHQGNRRFIRVTWRWGLQFAMWVLVPEPHLDALCAALQLRCDEVRDHLQQGGYQFTNPNIEVVVD